MATTNSFRSRRVLEAPSPPVIQSIAEIYEFRGKQTLYEKSAPEVLDALRRKAAIESVDASNRIEQVIASPERVREIVDAGAAPVSRSEAEIAGYRDVLSTIHASHPDIPIRPGYILQLHRDLMKYATGATPGGQWKTVDNYIEATLPNGTKEVIFRPVSAFETPAAMDALCEDFNAAWKSQPVNQLLILSGFVLDFLCIHPFSNGNGRMARLFTTLLLYHSGFNVSRYVSIERLVERTSPSYYATLRASSERWREGQHSLVPWWEYSLATVLAAYRELDDRLETSAVKSKVDRVRLAVSNLPEDFSVSDLKTHCPGVSTPTIRVALRGLKEEGAVKLIKGGRKARWRRLREGGLNG